MRAEALAWQARSILPRGSRLLCFAAPPEDVRAEALSQRIARSVLPREQPQPIASKSLTLTQRLAQIPHARSILRVSKPATMVDDSDRDLSLDGIEDEAASPSDGHHVSRRRRRRRRRQRGATSSDSNSSDSEPSPHSHDSESEHHASPPRRRRHDQVDAPCTTKPKRRRKLFTVEEDAT